MKPIHFDLFSGIGGFALAAKWAGFKTIGFSEIDPFCCKVLEKNFQSVKNYGDVKNIKQLPKIDLITAELPCQPFSQAGNKKGVLDARYLWSDTRRLINNARPSWAIIENVSGLISLALDDIIADLENEGYKTIHYVLPACCANAPHRRDRLWIIAYSNSIRTHFRLSDRSRGYLQKNFNRHMAQIQSKWTQLKPDTWATYTARDWFAYNTAASRGNDGISGRMDQDRIKALGNAIVPQVIYPILRYIKLSYMELV